MNEYETRQFWDLKPPVIVNENYIKYCTEMEELNEKYKHDINCYKGLPMVQLQLSTYIMEDEKRIFNKYFS